MPAVNPAPAVSKPKGKIGGARPGAGHPIRVDWQDDFLKAYAERSGVHRCAAMVGVAPRTVYQEQSRNPVFAEAMADAREIYADTLEDDLVTQARKTGNPVGFIVRLKALRPLQYVEKHMMLAVNVDLDVPPEQARQVLADMLAHLTPSTQQAIGAGQVVDVTPSEGT